MAARQLLQHQLLKQESRSANGVKILGVYLKKTAHVLKGSLGFIALMTEDQDSLAIRSLNEVVADTQSPGVAAWASVSSWPMSSLEMFMGP